QRGGAWRACGRARGGNGDVTEVVTWVRHAEILLETVMERRMFGIVLSLVALAASSSSAQGPRPASPDGVSAAQVGGKYVRGNEAPVYQGGKWIEILYGRPLKRGRDLWGAGQDYGKMLNDTAPVWRAGANVSTRLKTEAPL